MGYSTVANKRELQRWKFISAANMGYLGPTTWGCGTIADGGVNDMYKLRLCRLYTSRRRPCTTRANATLNFVRGTASDTSNPRSPHRGSPEPEGRIAYRKVGFIYTLRPFGAGASSSTTSRCPQMKAASVHLNFPRDWWCNS